MKKSISLTESKLKRIIKESVKAILKENNQNDLLNNTINILRNDKSIFEVDDIQTSLTSAFENTNSNKIKGTIPSSILYAGFIHIGDKSFCLPLTQTMRGSLKRCDYYKDLINFNELACLYNNENDDEYILATIDCVFEDEDGVVVDTMLVDSGFGWYD